jgi:SnoaL-like domain
MTLEEVADRVAIRGLIDAYAHCADRRDADGQMALFTADTHFVVYMHARSGEPSMELHSRAELAPVSDDLNRYVATTHLPRAPRFHRRRRAHDHDRVDPLRRHVHKAGRKWPAAVFEAAQRAGSCSFDQQDPARRNGGTPRAAGQA